MSEQYDIYLQEHKEAVYKATVWMLNHLAAVEELSDYEVNCVLENVSGHDISKYGPAEYVPYDEYFYGTPNKNKFDRAWLHHIHHNPHHWQHWLLMQDDGTFKALEMPKVHVIEMVADWWSFSWRSGNLSEVFDWYAGHEGRIILHPKTKEYVETILGEIRELIGE